MSTTQQTRTQKLTALAAYGGGLAFGTAFDTFAQHGFIMGVLVPVTVGAGVWFGFKAGRLR